MIPIISALKICVILTKEAVSYVEANRIGFSSLEMKFLITCLIVSVERTVDIPNLLPNKEARVLLPVPDVPANKTSMFLLDSIYNKNIILNIQTKSEAI